MQRKILTWTDLDSLDIIGIAYTLLMEVLSDSKPFSDFKTIFPAKVSLLFQHCYVHIDNSIYLSLYQLTSENSKRLTASIFGFPSK